MDKPDNIEAILLTSSYLFDNSNGESNNYDTMKLILIAFGRSQRHAAFVQCAKAIFFEGLFRKHNVDSVNALIIKKKEGHGNMHPPAFGCYRNFFKKLDKPGPILLPGLEKRERLIIRYLSLYHNCVISVSNRVAREPAVPRKRDANRYSAFHLDPRFKDKPHDLRFLQLYKVHNLAYYDKVYLEGAKHTMFLLKKDVSLDNLGATYIYYDLECIKMFDTNTRDGSPMTRAPVW